MKLHLGCGRVIIPGWVNVDRIPSTNGWEKDDMLRASITQVDLRQPWPWKTNSVELITISHLLYCMTKEEKQHIIESCYRVLEPIVGIVRITEDDYASTASKYREVLHHNAPEPMLKSNVIAMLVKAGFMCVHQLGPSETLADDPMILQHRHADPPAVFFLEAQK